MVSSLCAFSKPFVLFYFTGSYVFTLPCYYSNPRGSEGDVADLETVTFPVTASKPMKASFYYHMYGNNMGQFKVHVNKHGSSAQSTEELSIVGSQIDEWLYSCINLPQTDASVSIKFSAILGDGCDSVTAIDDVMISEGTCAGIPYFQILMHHKQEYFSILQLIELVINWNHLDIHDINPNVLAVI